MPALILKSIWGKQPTVVLQYHNVNRQFSLCGGLKISTLLPEVPHFTFCLICVSLKLWRLCKCDNVLGDIFKAYYNRSRGKVVHNATCSLKNVIFSGNSQCESSHSNHTPKKSPCKTSSFHSQDSNGAVANTERDLLVLNDKTFCFHTCWKTKSSEITNVALSINKEFPISRHHGARGDQNLDLFWVLRLLTWHHTCYRKEVTFKCDVIKRGWTLMWFEICFFNGGVAHRYHTMKL